MNRITRYVVTELSVVFAVSVTVLTMLMVMIFLIQEGVRENLTFDTIAQLVPFTIPSALSFAIPGTCLFATCIVYGRMSANNEIIAVKAQGIPPSRLIWPGIVISFLLSLGTVYLNDLAVSWGRNGVYQVILNASARTIYSVLDAQGSFAKDKMSIVVDGVDDSNLINPMIEYHQNSSRMQIQAAVARLFVDREKSSLVVQARDSRMQIGDDETVILPSWHDFQVPLGNVTKREGPGNNPSNMPLREMESALDQQIRDVDSMQRNMAASAAFDMAGGNLMGLTNASWKQTNTDLEKQVYRVYRLRTEPWRRWANGFSCLCFVIVGAPLAIRMRKSDFWTIFAVCFFPILLAYYPLLMFGVGQAKSGALPPMIVWLGNIVMILVGLFLIRRVENR